MPATAIQHTERSTEGASSSQGRTVWMIRRRTFGYGVDETLCAAPKAQAEAARRSQPDGRNGQLIALKNALDEASLHSSFPAAPAAEAEVQRKSH